MKNLMKKSVYVAVLGLSLISAGAYASSNGVVAADDDATIANTGQSYGSHHSHMRELSAVIDDDASIVNTGEMGQHVAHSADLEASLFPSNDLAL